MKLVTFLAENNTEHIGVLDDDDRAIVVLQAGALEKDGVKSLYFTSMLAFLEGGQEAREKGQEIVAYVESQRPPDAIIPLDAVTLLAPGPRPESIRDCLTFEQHIINSIRVVGLKRFAPIDEWIERTFGRKRSLAYFANKAWYKRPLYYMGAPPGEYKAGIGAFGCERAPSFRVVLMPCGHSVETVDRLKEPICTRFQYLPSSLGFSRPRNPRYEDQIETFPYFFRGFTIGKISSTKRFGTV